MYPQVNSHTAWKQFLTAKLLRDKVIKSYIEIQVAGSVCWLMSNKQDITADVAHAFGYLLNDDGGIICHKVTPGQILDNVLRLGMPAVDLGDLTEEVSPIGDNRQDVITGLRALGYKQGECIRMLKNIDTTLPAEQVILLALQNA